MSTRKFLFALLAVAGTVVSTGSFAQQPQFLETFRDWNLYTFNDNGQKLCYVASEPKKQDGNYSKRGAAAVLVTRLPGSPPIDEVSVQPGYAYLPGSDVAITIDGTRFSLFTQGEHAWANSDADDKALIAAMMDGVDMVVHGTSTKKTKSVDTYSLLGFTAAFNSMVETCAS